MASLSVLIPARCERWLSRTVADVCANKRGDTNVIVILDGAWPEPGYELQQHPDVHVVYHADPIGQRAATNLAARLSTADYVMKADAHVAFDEGFDVKLMAAAEELGPGVVQIPAQYNLHCFDWMCDDCGIRTYQGPTPASCSCGSTSLHREMVWKPRLSRRTERWRFDSDLHFQYWGGARDEGDFVETMSCLGACWFLSREHYWTLDGMDESHGSWGQMGVELACKTWLSGGRMVTNRRTFFAHLFRTQGGDFSFPYPMTGKEQESARQYSRALWFGNNWPRQIRPLSWLVEKFAPVPSWHEPSGAEALRRVHAAGVAFALRSEVGLIPSGPSLPSEIAVVAGFGGADSAASGVAADACRELMPVGAVSLASVDGVAALLGSEHVLGVANESQVDRIAAGRPAACVVVQHGDVAAPTLVGERLHQPREHESVDVCVGAVEAHDAVSPGVLRGLPDPASCAVVDGYFGKDPREGSGIEVGGDREMLAASHSSASIADGRLEPASRYQRNVGSSSLSRSIVYYTDNRLDPAINFAVQQQLLSIGLPIVSVSLTPIAFGRNVVLPLERSCLTMFKQILAGLLVAESDVVYFCEHDVLMHPSHFDFVPADREKVFYNQHIYKVSADDGRALHYRCSQTSGLVGYRDVLIEHYRKRVAIVEAKGYSRSMGFEPGSHNRPERVDDLKSDTFFSAYPNVDIRHGSNLTPSRWRREQFRNQRYTEGWTEADEIPGWMGRTRGRFPQWLAENVGAAVYA